MCGIIGAITSQNTVPTLLDGLSKLEYRGYDSAGIAVINAQHELKRLRTLGKIQVLREALKKDPLEGNIGIAHTRWATHGVPSVENAHPHLAGNIALVHNGIVENHRNIRDKLTTLGCELSSQTDSELIAHLVYLQIKTGKKFLEAVFHTIKELQGAFSLGILCQSEPEHLIGVRNGSPLVVGLGEHQNYIASDAAAIAKVAKRFIYLEDGDIADIYHDNVTIYDINQKKVDRPIQEYHATSVDISKDDYQHFMLKEIHEQPATITATLAERIVNDRVLIEMFGERSEDIFKQIRRLKIVACGSSYYAGLVGAEWIEKLANLPCKVEIASENRYRHQIVEPDTLFVAISQSGETADTLAALRLAKKSGFTATLAICNVDQSSIALESDLLFITDAGREIGVASTKAFTAQMVALLLLALSIGRAQSTIKDAYETDIVKQLINLPHKINEAFKLENAIKQLAVNLVDKTSALFIARGMELPIAMEGALKLKEISYIHAESYPAGELKHGPIALIDGNTPVIALAPHNELFKKIESNLEEISARKGELLIFTDKDTGLKFGNILILPEVMDILSPFIYVIPMQLLAYHVAVLKGNDVDQPRNLAKSVTVE